MELTLDQKDILVAAVINNTVVAGKFDANEYNVCDLMSMNNTSLVMLGNSLKTYISRCKNSIRPDESIITRLSKDLELVLSIITIRDQMIAKAKEVELLKAEATKELEVLMNRAAKDKLNKIKKLSIEEVHEQIAAYKAIIES